MGREQREMDRRLREAEAAASQMDRERREAVNKVEGYQRAADKATEDMSKSTSLLSYSSLLLLFVLILAL